MLSSLKEDLKLCSSEQARPLLEEWNLGELVDPRLEGVYDVAQMNSMILAASLCVRQSAQRRPRINRVRILQLG